jgi:hypothetical protein
MKRSWVVGLVAAVLAGNGLYAVWARADGPKPSGSAKVGKYILVHDRVTNMAIPVEKADVQLIGGKTFLVGMGATGAKVRNPASGRPVWVNLEDASTVVHFDSLEELEKAVAEGQPDREH